MQNKSIFLTQDHVQGLLPYLKWVSESAPRKQYREAAKSLISKTRGVKDWKQIIVTKREEEVLDAVHSAFPYEVIVPKQLKMKM